MRRRNRRKLGISFKDQYFKPRGIPLRQLEEIVISHEELETLRLRYQKEMSQADAAEKMGISQSQYQRDLWSTHKKLTDALLNGKAIKLSVE